MLDADADDQHGDEAGAPVAQRAPEEAVEPRPRDGGHADGGDRRGDQVPPQGDVEEVGRQGAEGHHLAVGEVGQPGRAEDQRQADGAHGDDQPEADALDEQSGGPVGVGADLAAAGVAELQREEHRRVGAALAHPHAQLGAVVADRHVVGQVTLGDRDRVAARRGDRDLEQPVGVAHARVGERPVGGLDRDLDVLDRHPLARLVLVAEAARDHLPLGGLGAAGGGGGGSRGRRGGGRRLLRAHRRCQRQHGRACDQ